MLNNQHTYSDQKQANFEIVKYNIGNITWNRVFSKMSVDQAASYLQNIIFELINKYVPDKVYRKSNFLQYRENLKLIFFVFLMAHKKCKLLAHKLIIITFLFFELNARWLQRNVLRLLYITLKSISCSISVAKISQCREVPLCIPLLLLFKNPFSSRVS